MVDEVARLSNLSRLLAPGLIRRALEDIGANVEHASSEDFEVALPKIETRIRAYLSPDEAQQSLDSIRALLLTSKRARR